MQIVYHPHPALTWKSSDVTRIDPQLRAVVREMFGLMYEAKGIGLAANQVGLPFRFFIVNLTGDPEETDEELVFINPVIRKRKGAEFGEEGCLSVPGIYAEVQRAEEVVIEAFDLEGQPIQATLDDLAARVVQHETDHLDGVMFTERLSESLRREVDGKLAEFEHRFRQAQEAGEIASDEEIRRQLDEMSRTGQFEPASK
ncbi:Peptide deformylase [Maioricimonas rarisocia]|uniref:Peptide deformylase n=1 Tax=Maioricimonas rarisocia TaxID=2528026 RepID=A0A517Z9L2_9PLAN|nr:peptide deformylase [Maioricimonas rarisocia]QDU39176.1 Peptide deformylase [Maioricimonas rarisocia]